MAIVGSSIIQSITNLVDLANLSIFNVKDYGALGNGINDDAPAIQAAINAAFAAGGGLVFCPIGVYLISARLLVKSYVRLAGPGGSVIYDPAITSTSTIIRVKAGSVLTRAIEFTGARGAEIMDIEVDGNNVAGPVDGLYAASGSNFDCRVIRVRVRRFTGWGVNWDSMKHTWLFQTAFVESNTLGGVKLVNCNDGSFETSCRIHHNTGPGLLLNNSKTAQFNGGKIEWNGTYGIQLQNSTQLWEFNGVYVDRNGKAGLYTEDSTVSKHTFTGCQFHRNSALDLNTADTDRSNVYLNAIGSTFLNNCVFDQGNSQDDGSGIAVPRQGLVINDTTRLSVADCRIRDGATDALGDFKRNGTNILLRVFALAEFADYEILLTDAAGALWLGFSQRAGFQLAVASPAALGVGNNNNYDPGDGNTTLRLSANGAGSTLTGLVNNNASGRRIRIINVSANALTLSHQDANSSANNRILSPTGANIVLGADDIADLEYDLTSIRWRVASVLT